VCGLSHIVGQELNGNRPLDNLKLLPYHVESKLLVKQSEKLVALSHFAKVFPLLFDGPKFAKL
jgi:hypothetical protein